MTDRRGRFSLRVPAGPSRTYRLAFNGGGGALGAARSVSVRVPASSTIRASRTRVSGRTRVRFSGRLRSRGQRIPGRGLVLVLQGREQGRWRTFEDTRTNGKGRWHVELHLQRPARALPDPRPHPAPVELPVRARLLASADRPRRLRERGASLTPACLLGTRRAARPPLPARSSRTLVWRSASCSACLATRTPGTLRGDALHELDRSDASAQTGWASRSDVAGAGLSSERVPRRHRGRPSPRRRARGRTPGSRTARTWAGRSRHRRTRRSGATRSGDPSTRSLAWRAVRTGATPTSSTTMPGSRSTPASRRLLPRLHDAVRDARGSRRSVLRREPEGPHRSRPQAPHRGDGVRRTPPRPATRGKPGRVRDLLGASRAHRSPTRPSSPIHRPGR